MNKNEEAGLPEQKKGIHGHIHDIKTSLQSLMVANEMVMEDAKQGIKNEILLKTMMFDIIRINETVDLIAKDFGEGDS